MGMREDLEIPLTMLSINYLDKLKYKGSYNGKRFIFEKNKIDDKEILRVYVWKDIFNFENTLKDDIIVKDYEYSIEGINEGLNFVEELNL